MARKTNDWINTFYAYTSTLSSPKLFRRWAGISAIAGAMQRNMWIETSLGILYPNLYVFVISPPGVGKSLLTARIRNMWKASPDLHVAAASLTSASIVDDLKDAERIIVRPKSTPSVVSYNSLLIATNELGVLLPTYEEQFMAKLTDIYDCADYSEKRRGNDLHIDLDKVQMNIFAAGTPSYLSDTLPPGAWEQGFLSRTILIYSGDVQPVDLFADVVSQKGVQKDLQVDLEHISKLYGVIKFTANAAKLMGTWHLGGNKPKPAHPRLQHYNTRRSAHVLKLCMVASIAESDELVIHTRHYQQAMEWITEAELHMPDIFKAMASGGDMVVIKEAWHYMYDLWIKNEIPVPETLLYTFLNTRVPAIQTVRLVDTMVKGGIFTEVTVAKFGKCFKVLKPKG